VSCGADPQRRKENTMTKEIRVRLRHVWVTLMAFPLTEEQAALLAAGDKSDLTAQRPYEMEFTPPVCQRCQLNYDEAPYSCPEEPSSFAPNGDPIFG
jgi:hypothetical protein